MDSQYLINLKETIEKMDIINQKEVLNIFKDNSVNISEINNGSFINLSNISKEVIDKIEKYIKYFNEKQSNLEYIEHEKINIQNEFFYSNKDKKNNKNNENNEALIKII